VLTEINVTNSGSIPTHFELISSLTISTIEVDEVTISGSNIEYWNSKTGIIKNNTDQIINYTGNGTYKIPAGKTVTFKITHSYGAHNQITIYHNNWYY
jgi:hypothetical protein